MHVVVKIIVVGKSVHCLILRTNILMAFTKASGCMTLPRDITMLSVILKVQVKYEVWPSHFVLTFLLSEFDCNDRIKPKDCVVEKYLVGQKDAPGGTCPRGTHKFGEHCCCMDGCCWADCSWGYQGSSPPDSCLSAIPNARWVKNPKKNGYIAVRNRPWSPQQTSSKLVEKN